MNEFKIVSFKAGELSNVLGVVEFGNLVGTLREEGLLVSLVNFSDKVVLTYYAEESRVIYPVFDEYGAIVNFIMTFEEDVMIDREEDV